MVFGALVIVIVGIFVVNYFKDKSGLTLPEGLTTNSTKEYVVVKGDSLWSIAEANYGDGFKWKDLAKDNNLSSSTLEIGQKLVISEIVTVAPTEQTISSSSYTVVTGDSLWQIAVRSYGDGYAWTRIATANGLANPNLIHAGNMLTLPR